MRTSHVRSIFIFFMIFLPFQYALVGIIGISSGEPWPAFVFPGFKSVYTYEDGFELSNTVFEIHQEGTAEMISLKPHRFLPDVPTSQISGFMRTNFSSKEGTSTFNAETKNWLMNRAMNFADAPVTDVQVVWQQNFYTKPVIRTRPDSTIENRRFSLINGGIGNE